MTGCQSESLGGQFLLNGISCMETEKDLKLLNHLYVNGAILHPLSQVLSLTGLYTCWPIVSARPIYWEWLSCTIVTAQRYWYDGT